MTARAKPKVFIDNERVRVTEWRFAPGAATGWHRHQMDYVVVPMLDGELELVGPDRERTRAKLSKGVPYFRNAGSSTTSSTPTPSSSPSSRSS